MDDALSPRMLLFILYRDYVHPLGEQDVYVGTLVRAAEELDISGNALRSTVSRMTREGWLATQRVGGRPLYRLTPDGRALIEESTALVDGPPHGAWDGRWLLVTSSLPEARRRDRDRLRQDLGYLGFGSLGNGIFVSPRDMRSEVREAIARCGVEHEVTVHHGTLEWPMDASALVAQAWELDKVAQSYRKLARDLRRELAREARLSESEAFTHRFVLRRRFRQLLPRRVYHPLQSRFAFVDPDLPDELLPDEWIGHQARALFVELDAALRDRAERFWAQISAPRTRVPSAG
jgi:phenylacetic acid degradation operon negative regulatory protein